MIIVRLDRPRRHSASSANKFDSHVAGFKTEETTPKAQRFARRNNVVITQPVEDGLVPMMHVGWWERL
jgi:hypothetical protein